tara:strand:- start:116 stop:310 length:195 start_codon:yes stop_codon:yes gene_type:complete
LFLTLIGIKYKKQFLRMKFKLHSIPNQADLNKTTLIKDNVKLAKWHLQTFNPELKVIEKERVYK